MFVAGTRVGIQVIPETVRDLVVVPTNAGTRQCVVARPPDRQGATRIATNSSSNGTRNKASRRFREALCTYHACT